MLKYTVRRVLMLIPVLIGISIMVFFITRVVPSDPVMVAAGGDMGNVSEETLNAIRAKHGLDKPLPVQYIVYMSNIFRGDFGVSIVSNRPVAQELRQYLPATLELTLASFTIAVSVGIPLGIAAAANRRSAFDRIVLTLSSISLGMPGFWLAIMLLVVFYVVLQLTPGGGRLDPQLTAPDYVTGMYVFDSLISGNWQTLRSSLHHLLLPSIALAISPIAAISRMMRGSMIDVLSADYMTTARSKGLTERAVIFRHAVRNALMAPVTQLGLILANFLGGAFFIEWVFSWNGIGRYAVTAMKNVDYNPVMAVTILVAVIYLSLNLLVDILYVFLDPRIRYD